MRPLSITLRYRTTTGRNLRTESVSCWSVNQNQKSANIDIQRNIPMERHMYLRQNMLLPKGLTPNVG
jgi:hypothetical protein